MKKVLIKNPLKTSILDDINKSKVILIRHAESEFNLSLKNMQEKITQENEQKKLHKNLSTHRELVDSFITEKGINQCINAGKELSKTPIKYVFTSPLRRSLETCKLVLQSKYTEKEKLEKEINSEEKLNANEGLLPIKEILSNKNEKIKIIVHPFLFEKIEDSCDLIEDIYKNRDDYKEFDWSLFNSFNRNNILYYQANFCDNIPQGEIKDLKKEENFENNYLEEINKQIKSKNLKENNEIINVYLDVIIKGISSNFENNEFIESSFKTIERLDYFKNFLLEFIEMNKINDENLNDKILVFGHSMIFKHWTSKNLLEEDLSPPLEEFKLKNCEFVGIKFDNI